MTSWIITQKAKRLPKLKKPILIEGLPGIGNVGKVAVDFIIEELKAEKLYDIFSYTFPHSVFVNEKNLVELPQIEMYYKKLKGKHDLLLLSGDVQPIDEISSYEFSEEMIKIVGKFGGKNIITLGGIGLQTIPKKPKIYCTGNSKDMIDEYSKGVKVDKKLYGVVGPIIGVSGLLLGLASRVNMKAISLLAETFGHPMYLGVKGGREILKILNKKIGLGINLNKLDREIEDIETEMLKRTDDLANVSKGAALKKMKGKFGDDVNYIG